LYDLIVVGAGPAGSTAAREASARGLDVLLVDRELEIGVPDKCGEFLPNLKEMKRLAPRAVDLVGLFDPPSSCIVNRTKYVKFVFPNGREIILPFEGVVVERKLFDKHLANEAVRAGVEAMTFTRVLDLLGEGMGVRARNIERDLDIHSRAVVAADGTYSLIARRAGLPVSRDPLDYSVGYQYEMVNMNHDPDYVEMHIGDDIAPGTYAWVIPKGDDVANIGTGVRAPYMRKGLNVRDYLRNFLEKPSIASKVRRAAPTAIKAGCIPVGGPMERTTAENVLAVGDAGGHTIPTVGGGVPPGLICGRIAGNAAADHILKGEALIQFDRIWRAQMGSVLDNSLRIRKMSDIIFRDERMTDLITKRGWLTEKMIEKFVLCKMDTKMKLVEKTLRLMR
jgi:digeranylgeranylglycerophospholipid reductase